MALICTHLPEECWTEKAVNASNANLTLTAPGVQPLKVNCCAPPPNDALAQLAFLRHCYQESPAFVYHENSKADRHMAHGHL